MSVREGAYTLVLLVASTLIVIGVRLVNEPAAYIAAGLLLGLVGWLVLSGRE